MADLMDYSIVPDGNVVATVPQFLVSGKVVDSEDQDVVIHDYTGPNAVVFPDVLATMSSDQQAAFIQMSANWITQTIFLAGVA